MYLFADVSTGSYNPVLLEFGRLSFCPENKVEEATKSGLQVVAHGKQTKKYISLVFLLFMHTAHRCISFCTCKCILPFRISTIFRFWALIISYPRAHSVQPVSLPVSFHTHSCSCLRGVPTICNIVEFYSLQWKLWTADVTSI